MSRRRWAKLTVVQAVEIMHSRKRPEHKRWIAEINRVLNTILAEARQGRK